MAAATPAADWRPGAKPAVAPGALRLKLAAAAAAVVVVAGVGAALGVLRPWLQKPDASASASPAGGYVPSADTAAVRAHVAANVAFVMRNASGVLGFPYLIPAGGFEQLWDWDAIFLGVATARFGTARYFAGSMLNFLSNVSMPDGEVKGCLTPDGSTPYLRHAKPMIIFGAYLAARATGDFAAFRPWDAQMLALLGFWQTPPRYENASGCSLWFEMIESGADNLAYVPCAADSMPCWRPELAYAVATPDLPVFRERQATAYALFQQRWAEQDAAAAAAAAARARAAAAAAASAKAAPLTAAAANAEAAAAAATEAKAEAAAAAAAAAESALRAASAAAALRDDAARCLDSLWHAPSGAWAARNVSSGALLPTRTYLLAWPLWAAGARGEAPERAAAAAAAIAAADMVSADSQLVRSLSNTDALYTNEVAIPGVIGSNWRGPAWIHTNALLAYSLAALGRVDAAKALARAVVRALAGDLERTGTWHENYDSENISHVMGAAGFLSFNTLGADLEENIARSVDPFALEIFTEKL